MNVEVNYLLSIPDDYATNRSKLKWATSGEAVENPDGSTFAFDREIGLFLEGFNSSGGPLIHFAHILHFLRWLNTRYDVEVAFGRPIGLELEDVGPLVDAEGLSFAFREAKRPHRNAGALAAWLCRDVPPVPSQPDVVELCRGLMNGSLAPELAVGARSPTIWQQDSPALTADEFEAHVLKSFWELTAEEVACWFRHGRGTEPDPGERVAGTIVAHKPKTLEGMIASLSGRDRLSAAVPIVTQLVSALTLPPRRLAHEALPSGGYADVATRGRPEQILPSQFAIDDIEFLRRFAENELLYFHREEPHAPVTEELVLLLDQGVRTWGRVRHALAASALALSKLAVRRKLPLLVAGTSSFGRLYDPLETEDEVLGSLWESSDLSPNPSLALEQVLESSGTRRRDVVVLTHPRNAAEADFASAARLGPPGTRVFSVSIDEPGQVQFREWRKGVPVRLGDFKVDFTPPSISPRNPGPATGGADPRGWRGEIEPVPFPFRFGVVHRIEKPLFDFDQSGRWLLLCSHRGMLHAWKLDGSSVEVIPRAVIDEEVLDRVDAVIGVADGFVVAGRIGKMLVAMHYDFGSRMARASVLGPSFEGEWLWFYSREVHTVVARGRNYSRSLDLSTREIHVSRDGKARPSARAIRAFEMANNHFVPPPRLVFVDEGTPAPVKGQSVKLDRDTGTIELDGVFPDWEAFTPLADGLPTLRRCWIDHAQLRGNVLALVVSGPNRQTLIRLYHGPSGVPNRELVPSSSDPASLVLSQDGRMIARRLGERQLEVRETAGAGQPILVTAKGKTHPDPKVTLGRYGMVIHVGKHVSLIRWDRDKLTVSTVAEGSTRSEHDVITWPIDRPAVRGAPLPALLDYDPRRFIACARAELTAVVDVFGQVALFDADERLIAMFVAFRSQVAAWTPDGTRFGPSQGASPLIDGPATRDAAEIIGRALKAASEASRDQGKR